MSNKEVSQPTIAELMSRSRRAGKRGSNERSFFKKPTAVRAGKATDAGGKSHEILGRLRENNMLVPGSKLGQAYYDEYRRIKRPLLSNAFGRTAETVDNGNVILVTSSIPGEGKTHTSVNLALSIAQERDHTVLLIDGDVARRGTSRLLGLKSEKGLVDALIDPDTSIGDVILRTDVPELSIIPAGKKHDYIAELLSSQKMVELVSEIGQRYEDRMIIFDGPPLLPTPETQILTTLVGQVVFVIETGNTPQDIVEEALDMIPAEQAVGIVMNKSEGMSSRGGYYYGYYAAVDDDND